MEKIQNFEAVLQSIKNYQIIRIESPVRTVFAYIDDRIHAKMDYAQFSLSITEFTDLYINSIFYYHEKSSSTDIEVTKDEEYYAWKHK